MKTKFLIAAAIAAFATQANAAPILTQIAANYTQSAIGYSSQDFETANNAFDVAVIDDFSLAGATTLTQIQAAFAGSNSTSLSGATGFRVEIYSSAAAAAANLTGNIASVLIGSGSATITNPFIYTPSRLITLPVNIDLSAGTYWLSVMAVANLSGGGQTYVFSNGTGTGNAMQVNPAGGFSFAGNSRALDASAAYNITGNVAAVPEPASWAMMIGGLGLVGATMRRRKVELRFA